MTKKQKKSLVWNMALIGLLYVASLGYMRLTDEGVIQGEAEAPVEQVQFESLIRSAATTHRVDPALITAVIHAESDFNPKAASRANARGLMQINAVTQRHLGVQNVWDPEENVLGGARYLRELLNTFGGRMELAIAAYNAGPGAVKRYSGVPPYRETQRYVVKVMKLYKEYRDLYARS